MNEPNYYAVIPAPVRYCEDITPNAKLLYGEISALCKQQGFCWATNAYFANLYKVGSSTISEWVASLSRNRFIRVSIDPSKGNERKIFLNDDPLRHLPMTSSGKSGEGYSEKPDSHIESSTKKNSTSNSGGKSGDNQSSQKPSSQKPSPTPSLSPLMNDAAFCAEWGHFIEHRKKLKKPLTGRAEQIILKKLEQRPQRAIEALQKCMEKGWHSFEWDYLDQQPRNGNSAAAFTAPPKVTMTRL